MRQFGERLLMITNNKCLGEIRKKKSMFFIEMCTLFSALFNIHLCKHQRSPLHSCIATDKGVEGWGGCGEGVSI